jgi:hypothetical protein
MMFGCLVTLNPFPEAHGAWRMNSYNPHEVNPHPIDPKVREQIKARLTAIEAEYQVRILYACESGSRGWGVASPDRLSIK